MKRKPLIIAMSTLLTAATAMPLAADMDREMAEDSADRTPGQVIDDMTIAGKLKAELAADPITDAMDIDIEVDRDRVQLNGFVKSDEARERAEELALAINGVESVTNNLEISEGERRTGEYIDDKTLTAKVKAALAKNDFAKSYTIDVEANRGIVSLGGHVDTEQQLEMAEKAAESVEGVRDVINNLEVRASS